jgi:hypothetical protein
LSEIYLNDGIGTIEPAVLTFNDKKFKKTVKLVLNFRATNPIFFKTEIGALPDFLRLTQMVIDGDFEVRVSRPLS